MILPIILYGNPILRRKCKDINPHYPFLKKMIEDMFETMDKAEGIGLAAPQIGQNVRLFIIDTKVFINSKVLNKYGKNYKYQEGCLSIPSLFEEIERPSHIEIEYFDEHWIKHKEILDGLNSRVIQHEYDHIEGKLFIDYLAPIKMGLLKNKLKEIYLGKVKTKYKIMK
ncbi:MAG TPA: peptide deformylase [Blattabacteriaceae bacterium]